MILTPTTDRKIQTIGSLALQEVNYYIDETATPHVTSILRNLYSKPLETIAREYVANAIDAHKEAGHPRLPIQIHLPTLSEPWFSVRDFGFGLSIEASKRLLFGYGASSDFKRSSNLAIGGFGNGCKSGFAHTDSFTYTIWHGGKKHVWNCYLDETDIGKAALISETPMLPEESTGIMVQIPCAPRLASDLLAGLKTVIPYVSNDQEFEITGVDTDQLTSLAPFDPIFTIEAEIEIDGVKYPVKYHKTDPLVDEHWHKYVIVHGFLYPLSIESDSNFVRHIHKYYFSARHFVLEVPNGVLQIAPTREELQYSIRTKRVINTLLDPLVTDEMEDKFKEKSLEWTKSINSRRLAQADYQFFRNAEITDRNVSSGRLFTHKDSGVTSLNSRSYEMAENLIKPPPSGQDWPHYWFRSLQKNHWITVNKYSDNKVFFLIIEEGEAPSKEEKLPDEIFRQFLTLIHPKLNPNEGFEVNVILTTSVNQLYKTTPWLTDGSFSEDQFYRLSDLPDEENPSIFYRPVKKATTRCRASSGPRAKPNPVIGSTRFLHFKEKPSNHTQASSRWWERFPITTLQELDRAYYVVLDKMDLVPPFSPQERNYPPGPIKAGLFANYHKDILHKILSNEDNPVHLIGVRQTDADKVKHYPNLICFWEEITRCFKQQPAKVRNKFVEQMVARQYFNNSPSSVYAAMEMFWPEKFYSKESRAFRNLFPTNTEQINPFWEVVNLVEAACSSITKQSTYAHLLTLFPPTPGSPMGKFLKDPSDTGHPVKEIFTEFNKHHPGVAYHLTHFFHYSLFAPNYLDGRRLLRFENPLFQKAFWTSHPEGNN